jgi:hypothetical protein
MRGCLLNARALIPGRVIAAVVAAVGIVALGSVVYAAIPGGTDHVFTGCYSTKTGSLRLIDVQAGQRCQSRTEAQVSWNQTGPQGVPGAQGPTGPAGVSGYQTIQQSYTVDPGVATYSATASCPSGTVVLGGGFSTDGSVAAQHLNVFSSAPYSNGVAQLFWVDARNDTASAIHLTVYATCASVTR